MASAMLAPCDTSTSPCRSFATISSGLYLFLGISVLLDAKRHTSSRTTSMGVAHELGLFEELRSIRAGVSELGGYSSLSDGRKKIGCSLLGSKSYRQRANYRFGS